ncbi:chaperone grpE [Mycolicibacterium canariasense]|uniref:Protein GrpE n=1 Tax=Mycolicibacterium canariasense TaxID=228230 RepID=A0A100WG29_MYCCR|nr:nucleotide exchange factor GrpE [Mycolicibacterium canariasense]MCV7209863.1 nucleotide exchange factor GrpE [Mycolicibacterium canariasense]ORV13843.1 molecular chaperone GrpE [Mycolicibacterium canariasense]GAS97874.1 chaperone grpE [Mycolicibacterium canariasense]
MSQDDSHEPVTITDKRRIDPVTGEIREQEPTSPEESGEAAPADASAGSGASEATGKIAELTADLQRVQAEFANYRKRAMRDQQVSAERAKVAVITQLLGVLDDLDRARSHGDLDSGPLKAVAEKLVSTLEGLGLSAFGAEGDPFDPALHEAVQHEGDGSNPVIGTVMRQGYKVGDQVVRHAMVGVVDTVEDAVNATPGAEQPAESEN